MVLQLANLHGDVAVAVPLTPGQAPQAFDADEYGNPKTAPIGRYGWLGAKRRSTETPTGNTLMGVRLYDPGTGRFLSVDPVARGNANAYEYCTADPINCFDLDGRFGWKKWVRRTVRATAIVGGAVFAGLFCGATGVVGCIVGSAIIGAAVGSIDYNARFLFRSRNRWNRTDYVKKVGWWAISGGAGGALRIPWVARLQRFF